MKSLLTVLSIGFMSFMNLMNMSSVAQAEMVSVAQLNQTLSQNHAGWVAKDTWLNQLPEDQLVRMMGVRDFKPAEVDFSIDPSTIKGSRVQDWRNVNGVNYVSPILNQGNCGSCVAFAAVGTMETALNIASGIPQLDRKLSAEALFACGGGSCDNGWYPGSAAAFLRSTGVPDEACAPYTMGATGLNTSCSNICSDSGRRATHLATYSSPSGMTAVKAALMKGPMITTLSVYADFITYASGVYKHTSGGMLGGHAVSIIGFDDVKKAWIIRNSWGDSWGMNGFAYISYTDISGVGKDNEFLQVPSESTYLVSSLTDRSFVSGTSKFSVDVKPYGKAQVEILDDHGTVVQTNACVVSPCPLSIDTSRIADGKYELKTTAGSGQLYRYFYVSNKNAALNIQMSPKGFNPSQAVKGRIEFDLNLRTGTVVPFQKIAFVYQDASGKIVERWSDNIADIMSTGWRTPAVPNGKYNVWMVGQYFSAGTTKNAQSNKIALTIQN